MSSSFIEPNDYDLKVVNNGCGSEGLKSILGSSNFLNFIFAPACMWHDFWYSKYSSMPRKEADEEFYKLMIELIKKGNYGFWKRSWYTLVAKDYYRLVRWYGESSYSKYDISSIMPSFIPAKNSKIRELKIQTIWFPKLGRWFTREESIEMGLITMSGGNRG